MVEPVVLFNYALKELTAKIVYYGPGLSGKTTNLKYIHEELPIKSKGRMLTLATETDRTLYFDFLPVEAGVVRGIKTRVQLYTVPGQVFYNATRRMVLKGADGVVFVADSQKDMMEANLESLENLRENLLAHDLVLEEVPFVMQYNKRDLEDALGIEEMNEKLNVLNAPFYASVAVEGVGVEDTLKAVSSLVLKSVIEKYGAAQASGMPAPPSAARAPAPASSPPAQNLLEKEKTDPFALSRTASAAESVPVGQEVGSHTGTELKAEPMNDPLGAEEPNEPFVGIEQSPPGNWPPNRPDLSGEPSDALPPPVEALKQTLSRGRKPISRTTDSNERRPSNMDDLNLEGILDEALRIDEKDKTKDPPRPEAELKDELEMVAGAQEHALSGTLEEVLGLGPEMDVPEPNPFGVEPPFGAGSPAPGGTTFDNDPATVLDNRFDALTTNPGATREPPVQDPATTQLLNGPPRSAPPEIGALEINLPEAAPPSAAAAPTVHVQTEVLGGVTEGQKVVVPVRISIDRDTDEIELNVSLNIKINRKS